MQTFAEYIRQAQATALKDKNVILIGEGVPDKKAVFGSTAGLKDQYPDRVFDMPVSENGVTGVMIGAALGGLKPIMVHQRIDFSLYAMDQIINNAAKWYSMFGGKSRNVPMVIRMVIGRGWGQGNQHSQNLAALYAHVPGLKVMMPSNGQDAYEMFLKAVDDPNPVLFLENKWLYASTHGPVKQSGHGATVVASGYAAWEASQKYKWAEIVDLNVLNPIDWAPIFDSVSRTKNLIVIEDAWEQGSISGEIIAKVCSEMQLESKPQRFTCPNYPAPSSPGLTKGYYPMTNHEPHDVDPFSKKVTSAI